MPEDMIATLGQKVAAEILREPDRNIRPDEPLISSGLIDSMSLVDVAILVEDTYGVHSVKLPAGHMVLYPSTSLHHVRPAEHGARLASFFWIQSMVRDDAQRALLFDLDRAIQRLEAGTPGHPSVVELTGVYHNLLRRWALV